LHTEKQRFDVSLEDLQTFLAVADAGSFTRVAEQLSLSQPSISNRIRRLEGKLGVVLFERSSRKVKITPDGQRLYDQTAVTLHSLKRVLQDFHSEQLARRRRIDIAATLMVASLALPPIVRSFEANHPDYSFGVHDGLPHACVESVRSGECDMGLLVLDDHDEPGIEFEPLTTDHCVIVTPRGHPLLEHEQVTLAQALEYPLLTLHAHHILKAVQRAAADRGLHVKLAPEVRSGSNQFLTLSMTAAGFGICIHPKSLIPHEFLPMLGMVPLSDCELPRRFGIVTSASRPLSAAASAFRHHLKASIVDPHKGWPEAEREQHP
jgi:DNA-binding transcriptional LysR family regulator